MNDKHSSQHPTRRQFLVASASGAALAGVPCTGLAQTREQISALDQYRPEYLNAAEWTFILAATARLIPSEGDGPGAIEARVPIFIDRQLAGDFGAARDWFMLGPHFPDADPRLGYQTPLAPAQIYREAIAAFNDWCRRTHGDIFARLDTAIQDEALSALQADKVGLPATLRDFFSLLLRNTREGYFADPMYGGNAGMAAWTYIGFPGARASYREWADQHNMPYPLGPVSISGQRGVSHHGTHRSQKRCGHCRTGLDRFHLGDGVGTGRSGNSGA